MGVEREHRRFRLRSGSRSEYGYRVEPQRGTDFPHPTCQYPGPAISAQRPSEYVEMALGDLPEETLKKVLHDTAARIYDIQ